MWTALKELLGFDIPEICLQEDSEKDVEQESEQHRQLQLVGKETTIFFGIIWRFVAAAIILGLALSQTELPPKSLPPRVRDVLIVLAALFAGYLILRNRSLT